MMERQTFSPCPYCDGRNNNCADCELQAYRASGLTPDELARAAELFRAEKEGRCVVLPCKVNDIVYQLYQTYTKCTKYECEFDESSCCGCECECDSKKIWKVRAIKPLCLSELAKFLDGFGKTVFLTRTEAEAALTEQKGR